jgi:hypothetical protein
MTWQDIQDYPGFACFSSCTTPQNILNYIATLENARTLADGVYVTGTGVNTAPAGSFYKAIYAHTATVVATATSKNNEYPAGTLTNVAIPAGSTWWGLFSTFTLTSGTVTAYYA